MLRPKISAINRFTKRKISIQRGPWASTDNWDLKKSNGLMTIMRSLALVGIPLRKTFLWNSVPGIRHLLRPRTFRIYTLFFFSQPRLSHVSEAFKRVLDSLTYIKCWVIYKPKLVLLASPSVINMSLSSGGDRKDLRITCLLPVLSPNSVIWHNVLAKLWHSGADKYNSHIFYFNQSREGQTPWWVAALNLNYT